LPLDEEHGRLSLHDLGEVVAASTLVLNILEWLNKKYDNLQTFLKWAMPFSSFHDVRNDLLHEELTLIHPT
jgi:hypothetical protein